MLRYLWITALVVVADQVTKWIANTQLEIEKTVQVSSYLKWYLAYNPGVAFSIGANSGDWARWFFTVLAIVISIVLVVWIRNLDKREKLTAFSLSLILGGAIGNVIDRIILGHVIDFIQVWLTILPWRIFNPWPAFNIADSAIFVGAVILILSGFIMPQKESNG